MVTKLKMFCVDLNSVLSNSFPGVYIMQNTMLGGGEGWSLGKKIKNGEVVGKMKKGGKLHKKREKGVKNANIRDKNNNISFILTNNPSKMCFFFKNFPLKHQKNTQKKTLLGDCF